jgi:hypothetical protein
MTNEITTLRAKARKAMQTGKVPNRQPDRSWGGYGSGAECSICDVKINDDGLEMELEFDGGGNGRPRKFHVHVECFTAWDLERLALGERALPARDPEPGTMDDGAPGLPVRA